VDLFGHDQCPENSACMTIRMPLKSYNHLKGNQHRKKGHWYIEAAQKEAKDAKRNSCCKTLNPSLLETFNGKNSQGAKEHFLPSFH